MHFSHQPTTQKRQWAQTSVFFELAGFLLFKCCFGYTLPGHLLEILGRYQGARSTHMQPCSYVLCTVLSVGSIIHESDKNFKPGLGVGSLQIRPSLFGLVQLSPSLQWSWRLNFFQKNVHLPTLLGSCTFNMKLSKSKLPSPIEDPSNGSQGYTFL